ncbi:MAG TPA: hypothetical protein VN612_16610 [Acidobacteriaceae bacterium]|nr:hypothetical protein [Acidobacteriaceae bacterium]
MDTTGESCIDHHAAVRVYWFDCGANMRTRSKIVPIETAVRRRFLKGISMKALSNSVLGTVAVLLTFFAAASAQTSKTTPSATAKPQAVTTAREASSGMATGREAASSPTSATSSNAKNSGHATEKVEYKDPEDMTTRYRPGNNKTTKTVQGPDTSSGASAAAHATAKETGLPACDGSSKDAAKCVAPSASSSQAASRMNKVESFTVKQ